MTIKQGDFVQLSYTGRVSETNAVFDTTDKSVAEDNNVAQKNKTYGPVTICLGEGQILPGLDESVIGKTESESYTITVAPEKAFGKKDAKLIQLIALAKFKEQNVEPKMGLTVYINEKMGFIKSVSGGRVLVDFNHPFSGKTVEYDVIVDKHVTDLSEQVKAILTLSKFDDTTVEVTGDKAIITFKNPIPEQMTKVVETHIKNLIKDITSVEFIIPKDFEATNK